MDISHLISEAEIWALLLLGLISDNVLMASTQVYRSLELCGWQSSADDQVDWSQGSESGDAKGRL